jgi:hypothetical protein
MAGTIDEFNRAQVEDALRFAMRMGAAPDPAQRATFLFRQVRVYPEGTLLDAEGTPLDPSVRAVVTTPDPVTVDCAVEFERATPEELPTGVRVPTRLVLTLLEDEYRQVRTAVRVRVGTDRYQLSYELPVVGLFDMAVHQIVAYAESET